MDSSEIGRFGTIRLMKRLQPDVQVAAYPIDEDNVTFGRDIACNVRLYYPDVSSLHCKIIFEERKAFLVVYGTNGLFVDGCKVLPASAASSPSSEPTTIPLANNSEIEIHSKRFRFTYPPKELRASLLSTPRQTATPNRRRALRMSMIQSAQVFSPRPSHDPRENLRVLQSPIRPFPTPRKLSPSSLSHQVPQQDHEDEEVILVDGNHPRVVEEDKDLVILEDVEVVDTEPTNDVGATPRQVAFSLPGNPPPSHITPAARPPVPILQTPQRPPPQTPRQRAPRPSLHRAVLIRSAQRAVIRAEMEKEEEEEEKEVEEFIAAEVVEEEGDDGSDGSSDEEEEDGDEETAGQRSRGMSTWRKSLGAVWPFRSSSVVQEDEDSTQDQGDDDDDVEELNEDTDEPIQIQTPRRAPGLGAFMTPQVAHNPGGRGRGAGRHSHIGTGGEARRVMLEPTWRVRDIVLPEAEDGNGVKEEGREEDVSTSGIGRGRGVRTSEDERKAIQERRRSAVRTPDTFFGGHAPGFSALASSPGRGLGGLASPASVNPAPLFGKVKQEKAQEDDDDDEMDTRSLLERMKETVEGMQRRRSMNVRLSLGARERMSMSPRKQEGGFSLLAPGVSEEMELNRQAIAEEDEGEYGELAGGDEVEEDLAAIDEDDDKENGGTGNISDEMPPIERQTPQAKVQIGLRPDPSTPRMDGLRSMFAQPRQEPKTPSFKGIRDMFKADVARIIPETPVFEGVGEMMQTPEGYRSVLPLEVESINKEEGLADDDDVIEIEEEVSVADNALTTKHSSLPSQDSPVMATASVENATGRKAGRKTAIETPSFADDDVTPGGETTAPKKKGKVGSRQVDTDEEDNQVSKPRARLLRGRKTVEDIIEEPPTAPTKLSRLRKPKADQVDEKLSRVASKSKSAIKPKAKTPSMIEIVEENSETVSDKAPVRRMRKAKELTVDVTPLEAESVQEEQQATVPTKTPARRGRKPAETDSATNEVTQPTSSAKVPSLRGRTPKARTDSEADVGVKPVRRARGKAQDMPVDVEEDQDHDPIDGLGGLVTPANPTKPERGRAIAASVIKEEVELAEAKISEIEGGIGKGRGRKATTPATRTRASSRKTPTVSIAPAAEGEFDKENTPGSGTGSADGHDDDVVVENRVKGKTKVTKQGKTPAGKAGISTEEESELVPGAGVRRGTRARARN